VSDGFLILFLALELEDQDLVTTSVGDDGGLRGSGGYQPAVIGKGGLDSQFDFGADIAGHFFHAENVSRCNPVLFSASFNDCVHANLNWEPEHTGCVGTTGVNIQCTTAGGPGPNGLRAAGREGDSFRIGLASNQSYISLYVGAGEGQPSIAERHKAALPKASIGKGCVRFKRLSDLDSAALEKMIREVAQAAAKA
jgi:hypothetical protein